ncbi:MAG: LysR family transcriptional regulator, partial [Erysipelotrichaceae bacterium]|nr:LysR family transcriptional regulator [Erysipelotrichaceae bacterium]
MDQKDIEMIIYLNKYGNMVDTAEKLFCTQSAVSLRLKKLEDELGVNIFDRIGKKLYLSENGKVVLDYAL